MKTYKPTLSFITRLLAFVEPKRSALRRKSAVGVLPAGLCTLLTIGFMPWLAQAQDTWMGNNSALFSTGGWTGANNPPISGDSLFFGAAGTAGTALTADQTAGISYAGIAFNAGASAFTIGGANGITLTGGITNNGTSLETLNFPIAATAVYPVMMTSGGGNITLGGNISDISGSGGLTLAGTGTLTLSGNNSFTGGITLTNSGTLQLQANAGNTSGGISSVMPPSPNQTLTAAQLPPGSTIQLLADSTVASDGVVAFDSGDSEIGANGPLLTGTYNFYVNQLTSGSTPTTLQFGPQTVGPASGWQVGNAPLNSTVTFNVTGGAGYTLQLGGFWVGWNDSLAFNLTNANLIVGGINNIPTGGLTKSGPGTLTLNNTCNYSGNTTINGGTLTIADPASLGTGSYAGNINNNGTLVYNSSVAQLLSGAISGTGALTQSGSGMLTLSGANTYTGTTTINGSIFANSVETVGTSGPLGKSAAANPGSIVFDGGTLQYSAANHNDYSGRFSTAANQPISIDANGQSVSFGTTLAGSGTSLTLADSAGGGTLTLAAAGGSSYTGGTTINSGTLLVNNTTGSGTGSGNVTVASGATLGGTGRISGSVDWQSGSSALFTKGSPLTVGVVTLNNNSVTVNVPGGTPLGLGTYTLMNYTASGSTGSFATGAPTYTGAGVAIFTVSSVSTSGGVVTLTVTSTKTADVWTNNANGNWSVAANWSSNPNVPHSAGDLATFGVGSALRTVTLDANETVGAISMTNANSFVIANSGKTLTLDDQGAGAFVEVAAGSANAIQTAVSLNDNTILILSAGASLNISGVVSNSTGIPETLTLSGAGTNILSGANTYGPSAGSVGTTLSDVGVLKVANNSGLGAGDLSIIANGTLQAGAAVVSLANNIDLGSSVTATVDNNGNALTLGGVISDSGGLTEIGNGTLTLAGANTYSGGTTVTAGTLALSGANATLGSSDNALTVKGGTLNLGGQSPPQVGAVTISGGTIQNGTLTGASFTATETTSATVSAALAGSAGLNHSGSGTLILSGNNTFTGGITLNSAGTLQLQANAGNTSGGVSSVMPAQNMTLAQLASGLTIQLRADSTVASGGVVSFDSGATVMGVNAFGQRLPGTYNFDVNNISTGTNTILYFGPQTAVTGSTGWQLGTAGGTPTFNVTGGNGYSLELDGLWVGNNLSVVFNPTTANLIIGGGIPSASTGGITKNGAGTLIFYGSYSHSGVTTINNGTLQNDGSISVSTSAVAVNGGTLDGIGTIAGPVTVGPSGNLGAGDAGATVGTLTINNNLTLQGNATLRIDRDVSPNSDSIGGVTNITYGGTLTISNLSATALVVGDMFHLFNASGSVSGNFSSIAGSPGPGLAYSFNKNSGVLSVVIAPLSGLKFTASPVISGTSLTISATNTGSGTVYLLTSTNVAASINTWTPVWTNVLSGSGSFTTNLPNAVNSALKQQFYILSNTNN
jgi:autotransporter-associated beta strand protein